MYEYALALIFCFKVLKCFFSAIYTLYFFASLIIIALSRTVSTDIVVFLAALWIIFLAAFILYYSVCQVLGGDDYVSLLVHWNLSKLFLSIISLNLADTKVSLLFIHF